MGVMVDEPVSGMEHIRDSFMETYSEDDARRMTRSWSAATLGIIEGGGSVSRDRAGEIACPVLLIAGERDKLATPELVRDLASRIPNAQAMVANGAGHGVSWDQPEWLNEMLLDFLSEA